MSIAGAHKNPKDQGSAQARPNTQVQNSERLIHVSFDIFLYLSAELEKKKNFTKLCSATFSFILKNIVSI